MLTSYEAQNHMRPVDFFHTRFVCDGQTERIELRGADVFCANSRAASDVILTLDTPAPRHPERAVTARIDNPPWALRAAVHRLTIDGRHHGRIAFVIVDGGKLVVDTTVYIGSYDSHGRVTMTFCVDRSAIPWPAPKPDGSNIPHVEMGW